ncbi:MAG: acetylglutamate kinase [Dethiobacteria bacterium]
MENLIAKAEILVESLPYIRKFAGKTFVIKYGGHAMINEELKEKVAIDVILLKYIGINPILVHGGGKEITEWSRKIGKESTFAGGLRVTDAETMELAEMVLTGKVNREIVSLINGRGGKAVGLSGRDANLFIARRLAPQKVAVDGKEELVDLGLVGEITEVNAAIIHDLIRQDYIPVVSSIGVDKKRQEGLNINADCAAGELAAALKAEKLILLTDVEGIMADPNGDRRKLISTLDKRTAAQMMADGRINEGMIPKVQSCLKALENGVSRTHIIDGRTHHSLLLEIFTDKGIGTMVVTE